MNLARRIAVFSQLGDHIERILLERPNALFQKAILENPWFTTENVALALTGIRKFLHKEALTQWTSSYPLEPSQEKTIGVAMAGNIPLVGFHDFLCVLISGHRLKAKMSSQDSILLTDLANRLMEIDATTRDSIQFSDRLHEVEAVIATGSDNTARYFEYYFRDIPHLIRKNRASCAVILGDESPDELKALGTDVFSYFGMGCRNVSKLYVPEKYDFTKLFQAWDQFGKILHHSRYLNNYQYQKSVILVNKTVFFDNGFILLKEEDALVSPVSVLYFERFTDQEDLLKKVKKNEPKIQCTVSARNRFNGSEAFGQSQFPEVSDYPDKVDTVNFLIGL